MNCFPAPGEPLEPETLTLDRARQVRDALTLYPFASLIEARRRVTDTRYEELLVVEIDTELPQDTDYDIRSPERLAFSFERGDRGYPAVLALRTDFPHVSHLYWTPAGNPKSLCLYEAPWAEVRLRWTGAGFLGDVAKWLCRTAVGELHAGDQPLEPFLYGPPHSVVVPLDLLAGVAERQAYAAIPVAELEGRPSVLKLVPVDENENPEARRMHVVVAAGEPAVQNAMHDCPQNLMELVDLLRRGGVYLVDAMVEQLQLLLEGGHHPREKDGLLLLVTLPRQRRPGSDPELREIWAFAIWPFRDAAIATGRFAASGPGDPLGRVLVPEFDEAKARELGVVALQPIGAIDRAAAKFHNGLDPEAPDPNVVLIGAGALGSQLHSHLSRMGWGRWTLIDEDTLLPHNVVRHRLGENVVGFPKAIALRCVSAAETPHNSVDRAFAEDFLSIEDNEEMIASCRDAHLIVDASTSIAVARYLARDLDSPARRASLFLNPKGRDAVMLMEDTGRSLPLDALESQYYRAVLRDGRLDQHIRKERTFRYSAGCRDVTARIGQDDVALGSALLSRQLRCADDQAIAAVWRQKDDGSVSRVEVPLSESILVDHGGWCFVLDHALVEYVGSLRRERLPAETGGVLVGYFDVPHRRLYIVDALPAPDDSHERRDAFVRGCAGLPDAIRDIEARTSSQVSYVGEWHSHPDGAGVGTSDDDRELLRQIAEEVRADGWPGVMMIVGPDRSFAFYALAA